jgi:hypothetical protein
MNPLLSAVKVLTAQAISYEMIRTFRLLYLNFLQVECRQVFYSGLHHFAAVQALGLEAIRPTGYFPRRQAGDCHICIETQDGARLPSRTPRPNVVGADRPQADSASCGRS